MTLQKHKESIGERLIEDQKAFLPIPDGTYQPCTLVSASASPSFQEIKNRGG
jgi:hypothetical protein